MTPEAQMFGCEPDFDAWRECVNEKPCADDKNLRSAGGHIHVGGDLAINNPVAVIRAMDLFLGVPSTQLDAGTLRRELYGKAGCFRAKRYKPIVLFLTSGFLTIHLFNGLSRVLNGH